MSLQAGAHESPCLSLQANRLLAQHKVSLVRLGVGSGIEYTFPRALPPLTVRTTGHIK